MLFTPLIVTFVWFETYVPIKECIQAVEVRKGIVINLYWLQREHTLENNRTPKSKGHWDLLTTNGVICLEGVSTFLYRHSAPKTSSSSRPPSV